MTTRRNDVLVGALGADLQPRYEPNFAWKSAVAVNLALGSLRGCWPLSSADNTGAALDVSGQARTLTYKGNPLYTADGLRWYLAFDGTGDHLSRADEAGLDIIGTETYVAAPGLTLGCWVRFGGAAAAVEHVLGKWLAAGNQRSYALVRTAAGLGCFQMSNAGAAIDGTISSTAVMAATAWYFLAGRFVPSTSVDVWVNDEQSTNAVAIPAAICNSTADFRISGTGAATNLLTGDVCLAWLCAAALPDVVVWSVFQQQRALFGV